MTAIFCDKKYINRQIVIQGNSFVLLLRVTTPINATGTEPQTKRRRLSELSPSTEEMQRLYGAELVIYDRHSRCLLIDGDYELAMKEIVPNESNGASPVGGVEKSPLKANTTWTPLETPAASPSNLLTQHPTLKFRLQWVDEASPAMVDR